MAKRLILATGLLVLNAFGSDNSANFLSENARQAIRDDVRKEAEGIKRRTPILTVGAAVSRATDSVMKKIQHSESYTSASSESQQEVLLFLKQCKQDVIATFSLKRPRADSATMVTSKKARKNPELSYTEKMESESEKRSREYRIPMDIARMQAASAMFESLERNKAMRVHNVKRQWNLARDMHYVADYRAQAKQRLVNALVGLPQKSPASRNLASEIEEAWENR